jgi:hypothetical protein
VIRPLLILSRSSAAGFIVPPESVKRKTQKEAD